MKLFGITILVLGAVALAVPDSFAKGILGERTFGVDGGWERQENNDSDDGWGIGVELNIPGPMATESTFGIDLNVRGDYVDIFDRDVFDVSGVLRAYMNPDFAVKPFVGVGFGWIDFDFDDTTYVPVEGGLEFGFADVAILPFFRYNFALDSGFDDFWTVGAKGVYWFNEVWGITASGDYTDYDDLAGIDEGWTVRAGLVFSY